jgi:hypothetical protein
MLASLDSSERRPAALRISLCADPLISLPGADELCGSLADLLRIRGKEGSSASLRVHFEVCQDQPAKAFETHQLGGASLTRPAVASSEPLAPVERRLPMLARPFLPPGRNVRPARLKTRLILKTRAAAGRAAPLLPQDTHPPLLGQHSQTSLVAALPVAPQTQLSTCPSPSGPPSPRASGATWVRLALPTPSDYLTVADATSHLFPDSLLRAFPLTPRPVLCTAIAKPRLTRHSSHITPSLDRRHHALQARSRVVQWLDRHPRD